jgi:hypothetical protein
MPPRISFNNDLTSGVNAPLDLEKYPNILRGKNLLISKVPLTLKQQISQIWLLWNFRSVSAMVWKFKIFHQKKKRPFCVCVQGYHFKNNPQKSKPIVRPTLVEGPGSNFLGTNLDSFEAN